MRELHCEKCGKEDNGFDLQTHLLTDAMLCAYCVSKLVNAWAQKKRAQKKREDYTLNFEEFTGQLAENQIYVESRKDFAHLIIRGENQDYGLAAIHEENGNLIFDLGHTI